MKWIGSLAAMGFLAACASPPSSQTSLPAGNQPYPPNVAELNAYLDGKDYIRLRDVTLHVTDGKQVLMDMNWERDKAVQGGSIFMSLLYARDTWRFANAAGIDAKSSYELKKTASMALLYSYIIAFVDGVKCADASAPAHRVTQLFSPMPGFDPRDIWRFLAALPDADLKQVIYNALKMESETIAFRGNDDILCRGGNAELNNADLRGAAENYFREHPGPVSGRVEIQVPANPNYTPEFLPREVWLPRQQQLREPATLRQKLLEPLLTKLRSL